MTPITNIKIARLGKKGGLVATAKEGNYMSAAKHPSQVIAVDAVKVTGQALEVNQYYTIAATGMPTTMNLLLDHINDTPSDGHVLYVFIEIR